MSDTKSRIDWAAVKERMQQVQATLDRGLDLEPARLAEIYRQRAAELAARRGDETGERDAMSVLVFALGNERYALELSDLVEVLPLTRSNPVPGADPVLLGVMNVAGEIRSVLDPARLFDLPEDGERPDGYVVLLRNGDIEFGLRVDQVERLETIARADLANPRETGSTLPVRYVRGITPTGVFVLDREAIFTHPIFTSETE
jgi:purine-binding chemotaxis protein CheW